MNLIPGANTDRGQTVVLAPSHAYIPTSFTRMTKEPAVHAVLLSNLQRLRGRVYVEDGAIKPSELTFDGRFIQPVDNYAWHLVRLDQDGEVCGCARYMSYSGPLRFTETGISRSPISRSRDWRSSVQSAIESDIQLAHGRRVDYVEVGGWALTEEIRCTSEALRIALGMFSLARLLGGCIGVTTATKRHCSASILRRIGGQPLRAEGVEIPSYFDPRFDCEMEILRFDSDRPNPRFEPWIDELAGYLSAVPVIRGAGWAGQSVHRDCLTAA